MTMMTGKTTVCFRLLVAKNLGIGNTAGPGGGLYAGNIREGTCYYFFFPSMLFEFFLVVFLFPALWQPRNVLFYAVPFLHFL